MALEKVLKLAEKMSEPWENHDPNLLAQSAAAIRALVEEVQAWRDRNAICDPKEYERALWTKVVPKMNDTDALNDGLEV